MLSIAKLQKLLAVKGFFARRFFLIHGLCTYVEVMSIRNADIFFLSISSKYKFKISKGNNAFKIRPIDMGDSTSGVSNTADEYAGSPDNIDLEKTYTEIDMTMSPELNKYSDRDKSVTSQLENAYKRPILLADISKEDTKNVKDIFRQLKRLRFCVQNIRYKLIILWKDYLCVLNRDGSIECFYIKNFPLSTTRRLMVSVDLELFYEKMEAVEGDISRIREGIYKVLDKNQEMHTRNINRMLEEKNDIIIYSRKVQNRKLKYQEYVQEFEKLLERLNQSEKAQLQELYKMEDDEGTAGLKGIHSDTTRFHQKGRIEAELSKIEGTKKDVLKNLMDIKTHREDMILTIDKIMFDNTVMFDQILRNFTKLEDILQQ